MPLLAPTWLVSSRSDRHTEEPLDVRSPDLAFSEGLVESASTIDIFAKKMRAIIIAENKDAETSGSIKAKASRSGQRGGILEETSLIRDVSRIASSYGASEYDSGQCTITKRHDARVGLHV